MNSYGADGVELGEGGLGVAEAAGGEVEEVVALVGEADEVATLVPALVRGVDGQGLVLLHVGQPLPEVELHKVASNEVPQTRPALRSHEARLRRCRLPAAEREDEAVVGGGERRRDRSLMEYRASNRSCSACSCH